MRLPHPARAQIVLGLALLATLPLANPYIRGEGNGHYAYLPSVALDRDLDFANEYRRGDPDFVTSNFRRADGHLWPPMETPTGRVRNQWPSGAALLWAPAFVQAHAAVLAARALGAAVPADGYALPYRAACAAATVVYSALALLLAARASEKLAGRPAALLAACGLWLASSLPAYMYFLPFYGHAPGAFATGLFLWWWLERRPMERAWEWAAWGASAGLVAVVDHFAIPVLLVAVVEWMGRAVTVLGEPRRRPAAASHLVPHALAFAASGLAMALPDLVARSLLHGSAWEGGRLTRFFWSEPRLWETGFSTQHGLFLWTPVVLASITGLVLLAIRQPAVGAPLLGAFGLTYYAVASYELWHGSSSFGNRYFVSLTPVFVVGLAELLRAAHGLLSRPGPRLRWAALGAGLAVLAAWNAGLLFQWGTGMIPRQGPVDPAVVARNQAAVPLRVASFAARYLRSREQAVRPR